MNLNQIIQRLFVLLAVITSMGTLLHDTRANRALAVAAPISNLSTDVASNLESLSHGASHTHVEEMRVASDGVQRVQARDDHRRYLIAKYQNRNNDFFGGSRILWPSH